MPRLAALVAATSLAAAVTFTAPGAAAALDLGQWHLNPATNHWYAEAAPLPWTDAEALAVKIGGHLVTINDQAEEVWLEATFPEPDLWIGLNDVAEEGSWVWTSGEPVTYTNWTPDNPDNWEIVPEGEDFAVMNATWAGVTGWDDWDGASNSWIVEVTVEPTATIGTMTITASTTLTLDHVGNIEVASDHVTLDCAGHSVTGAGGDWGILLAGRTGVTVQNCAVTGFLRGFVLTGSSQNRLEHNTATHNDRDHGTGFFVADASNGNLLESNTASANGVPGADNDGFRVQDSNDNILRTNVANGNATWGFIVVTGSGNVLESNVANGNALLGFALHAAVGTSLTGNSADANGVTNFDLCCASDGNTFRNNVSTNSGTGFGSYESSNNAFVGNSARENTSDGFWIWGSVGGSFSGNTLASNGNDGFAVYQSSNLAVDRNVSEANGWNGFLIDGTTDSRFTGNKAIANLDPGVGFWVRWGSDRNVFVGNTTKDNAHSGFIIENASSSRFEMNTSDLDALHGFSVANSASDVFLGNVVRGNGQAGHGFELVATNGMRLENNTAVGAAWNGFALYGGNSRATLIGNTATGSGSGFGLDDTTGSTLTGNRASGNADGPGFALGPGADSNVLSGNSAIDNNDGFQLWSWGDGGPAPSHNLLMANVANRNTVNGFGVQAGASYNSFVRNIGHANGDWDALQMPDAGAGNVWLGNRFGVAAGF